jgi:hypothetical protein
MKYPTLAELNTSREWLDVFKGYNHNLRIGEGEFYEMKNLSSDNYPILSPRSKRGMYAHPTTRGGMVAKDALCYVDGGDLIINKYNVSDRVPLGLRADDNPKTLISMGAYIIIMPDRKYINTENYNDYGDIDKKIDTTSKVTFELCTADGNPYGVTKSQAFAPEITEEMLQDNSKIPLWIDTSSSPNALKQYSTTNSMWSTIATTYIKISYPGIGLPFSLQDGITIIGVNDIPDLASPTSAVIWAMDERKNDDGDRVSDWIVVKGILKEKKEQTNSIRIQRVMPQMDFIIESGNRLWGCRYGIQGDKIVNEIYASKLGDFKNWNCFMGISTDSYAASVGTDGQFTGAITHLGYPLFFKENCIHKVYGNYPANYQIQTTACRGVQKGCERSLAIVNETLYYKARSGICAYDGSLPMEMSSALGDISYSNAVAGSLGNKYYISMCDDEERYHLFVYDTLKGMWHREDDTQALEFCNCRGDLYYIDHADKQIKTIKGTQGVKEDKPIKWEAVTGIIGTDSPDKKYISRMDVRMKLDVGARVSFYVEYDSSGVYEYLFTMTGKNLQSFPVPIRPRRSDHLRLKIVGVGEAKIFSICKTIEWGSDQ